MIPIHSLLILLGGMPENALRIVFGLIFPVDHPPDKSHIFAPLGLDHNPLVDKEIKVKGVLVIGAP